MRHAFASMAAHSGVPKQVLSEVMGHANVGITDRVYRHLYDRQSAEDAFRSAMSGSGLVRPFIGSREALATGSLFVLGLAGAARYPRRAVRPQRRGDRMAFTFKLQTRDGAPADPPTLLTAAPSWRPGDTIPLGRRTLRVVEVRPGDVDLDRDPVLVVEDMAG